MVDYLKGVRPAPTRGLLLIDVLMGDFRIVGKAVRGLSVNGVQSGAKRSNSGSVDFSICLDLTGRRCLAWAADLPYEPEGREFESLRARHSKTIPVLDFEVL
jgi:hypothetical protein